MAVHSLNVRRLGFTSYPKAKHQKCVIVVILQYLFSFIASYKSI